MNTVKERLIGYLRYKGIGQARFEKQCGFSNGFVNNMVKSMSEEKLQRVLLEFPDLNRDWLLHGEGSMLKSQPSGGSVSISGINVAGGHDNIVGSHNVHVGSDNELKAKVAVLENEIKHLQELLAQKDEMIRAQERTIGILMKTN